MSEMINQKLIPLALEQVSYHDFEKFSNAFFASLLGADFVPLGGVKDGGADGLLDTAREKGDNPKIFSQSSKTPDTESKIKSTIKRLQDFGREVQTVYYFCAVPVRLIDSIEEKMREQTGVQVVIRDAAYFAAHVNDCDGTRAAFHSYLEPALAYLREFGAVTTLPATEKVFGDHRALCVFLAQELERKQGEDKLLEAVTDSLIYWALEGTDPEQSVFMAEKEIVEKIIEILPSAKRFALSSVPARLRYLSTKEGGQDRRIRSHKKVGGYALPLSVRQAIEKEAVREELARLEVDGLLKVRASSLLETENSEYVDSVVGVVKKAIGAAFEKQGFQLATYYADADAEFVQTDLDVIVQSIVQNSMMTEVEQRIVFRWSLRVLRKFLFDGTPEEREYMNYLSRAYFVFFSLRNAPEIVEFQKEMFSRLRLYVGSDVFVRILAESCLEDAKRDWTNALRIFMDAGARLVLAEPTVEEVWTHIIAADLEFANHYREEQQFMKAEMIPSINRILIEAYFWARVRPDEHAHSPKGWAEIVNLWTRYEDLHHESGKDGLREYLLKRFNLEYEDRATMEAMVDREKLESFAAALLPVQNDRNKEETREILARNDALQALVVLEKRRVGGERPKSSRFGFRTWWLTEDTRVGVIYRRENPKFSAGFTMRPDFLLRFLDVSLSRERVAESFQRVFPTLLGVKIGRRIDANDLKMTMKRVREYNEHDPDRGEIELAHLTERLQQSAF